MDLLIDLQRRLKGRNLSEVARRAGMARDNVGRLAGGRQDDMRITTYEKLFSVLDAMDREGN